MPRRNIVIGRIAGAHGIRGDVLLQSFAQDPLDIAAYGPLQEENGARTFEIVSARLAGKGVVARLAGVADRTAAERLKGIVLTVPRERLPPPDAEEFYHADLIGLRAEDAASNAVGTVVAVQNHGASDILVIRRPGQEDLLVPFLRAFVPHVDLEAGRIVVAEKEARGEDVDD